MDEKLKYLAKALSRTKRKDYENYVVNSIYFRVGNKNLYPVSQQCVRGEENKFYYIDLYFPQLKIGIECDETFHKKQQEKDRLREIEIIRKLEALDVLTSINYQNIESIDISRAQRQEGVENDSNVIILRIDVSKTHEEVEEQIDKCVNIIKGKIAQKDIGNLFFKSKPEVFYKNKKEVSIYDNIIFHTNNDVCNIVLGQNYDGNQRQMIKLPENMLAWLPTKMDVSKPNVKGYANEISADGTKIYENTKDKAAREERIKNKRHIGEKRVVFAKTKDPVTGIVGYRFFGVFIGSKYVEDGTLIYERIAEEFKIIKKQS